MRATSGRVLTDARTERAGSESRSDSVSIISATSPGWFSGSGVIRGAFSVSADIEVRPTNAKSLIAIAFKGVCGETSRGSELSDGSKKGNCRTDA